jgi:N,N-dimethylformamidase beta subunit-like protein/Big-like domain-containing protein/HYDIN/CFA65/VesB family protein
VSARLRPGRGKLLQTPGALVTPRVSRRAMRIVVLLLACATLPITTKPLAAASGSNPIQQENSLPGTPGWNDFNYHTQQDLISGFGSQISINHGGSIDFYVTTTAASFTINIFRTGYYQGIGARLVQSLGSFPGLHQAIPAPDPVTGMIACTSWTKTTTLQIPSSWVTGVYLAKLTIPTGDSSFIFFVVRDDGGTEDLVFQTSVTTYKAYDTWGGTGLYQNTTDRSVYPYAHATKVSFDSPFIPDNGGAGAYFNWEYFFVYWLEQQGYNVTYTTDVDIDLTNTLLTNHKGFLSVGHDEYWSRSMRTNVQNAINVGVNVAFFSANTMGWQIRLEPNAAGLPGRVEVGYKDFATSPNAPGPDPQYGVNNAIVTTTWRDPLINQPENGIIGVMSESAAEGSYVVQNSNNWVYANTGFVDGTSVPGIVGYEYDRVWNNGFSPTGLTILSNSPVTDHRGFSSDSNSTIYTATSGARVFASGTIEWSLGLANIQWNTFANAGIQQTTANILNNFITGPIPNASLSTTSLNFNSGVVGTTSAAQAITLTNSGTATLNIGSITLTGSNPGDFAQTNNCPGTMGSNISCSINVTFTPTAVGDRSATVTLVDNAGNSPQTAALSGVGQTTAAPLVTLNPTSLGFGVQNVGTVSPVQTVTLSNIGTAPLSISSIASTGANPSDFSPTSNCPTGSNILPVNAFCTISVTFSPTLAGTRSANVTVTDNALDSPESVSLTGSAATSTIYFKDDFESGDFSQWNLPSGDSTGQQTVQTAVVNSGTYAAAFTISSGQFAYINTALPGGPQSQTFTRFYFRLTNAANGTILAIARDANGGNTWEVDYDGANQGLDFYFWDSLGTIYSLASANQAITANTWYSVEIQDTQTTSGQAQAWINGASVGVVNANLSNANPFARLMLYDGAVGTFYFDDVVVSNTYNGPVNSLATATALTATPNPSTFGQDTGSVTSNIGTPTGTVTFNQGTTTLASNVAVNESRQATLSISTLEVGSDTITASFTGTGNYGPSDGSVTETVNATATTATALTSTPNPSTFGQRDLHRHGNVEWRHADRDGDLQPGKDNARLERGGEWEGAGNVQYQHAGGGERHDHRELPRDGRLREQQGHFTDG